jgi:excisionase family DNA binding protein
MAWTSEVTGDSRFIGPGGLISTMTHEDDEEISVAEACHLLKISKSKFYDLVRHGELPVHRTIGGRRGAWKKDVLAARDRAAQQPTQPIRRPSPKRRPEV